MASWANGREVHMADDERGAVPADDPDDPLRTLMIATVLAAEGYPTKRNSAWIQPVVARILARYRADDAARYAIGDAPWLASDRTAGADHGGPHARTSHSAVRSGTMRS